MMKKKYIVPAIEVMDIESVEMIAASVPQIGIDPDGSGEEILSNKRRGSWGNLWDNP